MTFVRVPGLKGKVYVPEESGSSPKKKPCNDCFSCQQCSKDRCRVCRCGARSQKSGTGSEDGKELFNLKADCSQRIQQNGRHGTTPK